jgi:hypothetical protein
MRKRKWEIVALQGLVRGRVQVIQMPEKRWEAVGLDKDLERMLVPGGTEASNSNCSSFMAPPHRCP